MTPRNISPIAAAELAAPPANFDRVARPYRWMEYLTFGSAIWRCRTHFLSQLANSRNALALGDGDGRFTAALLEANPHLHVNAVDSSAAMLRLLEHRVNAAIHDASVRLRTHHSDALAFAHNLPTEPQYDLIVTHFFLDCLTQFEAESLARKIASHLKPGALWLVSDFRTPTGVVSWPARALVRSLYLAFHVLTGLRVTRLPDHAAAFHLAGLVQTAQHRSLAGILATELWRTTPSG